MKVILSALLLAAAFGVSVSAEEGVYVGETG